MAKGVNNFVAKHCREFNKSTVQACRKTRSKKGYTKHKSSKANMGY